MVPNADFDQCGWSGALQPRSLCVQEHATFGTVVCSRERGNDRNNMEYRTIRLLCEIGVRCHDFPSVLFSFLLYNSPPQFCSLTVACSGVMSR